MKIIDCFMYFDEDLILDIRLLNYTPSGGKLSLSESRKKVETPIHYVPKDFY